MTRGRKKKLQQHVRTSIVARTIYRIICVTLVVVGVFGLYQALTIADNYVAYTKRTAATKATIRGVRRTTDRYGNESCRVKYDFKLGDKEYSSKTGWQPAINYAGCYIKTADETAGQSQPGKYREVSQVKQATIRYDKLNPANNSYGDNQKDEEWLLFIAVTTAIISALPLGIGFVGLVAIHRALEIEEDALEEDQRAARKSKAKSERD